MQRTNPPIDAQKLARELRGVSTQYSEDLSREDKEKLAGLILKTIDVTFFDWDLEEARRLHPIADEIERLSNRLNWSNSSDLDADWQKLLASIDQLGKLGR